MINKRVHIIGGGTVSHVRNHLALAAPAYGHTARRLAALATERFPTMDVCLHLTKMADPDSVLETAEDVRVFTRSLVDDTRTKVVFFNAAIVDYEGRVDDIESQKYATRLSTADGARIIDATPIPKIIDGIRNEAGASGVRKDIFLVAFKTTCGASEEEQYRAGLNVLKRASANLVLANDTVTRRNMIITPEEAAYHVTLDRDEALRNVVDMAYLRSHLMFTRSTVVSGEPVPWESPLVPSALRTVVEYCIDRGAYKKFRGVTAGHFAVKLGPTMFLTSRRKTDFNDLKNIGLVRVETDGPDSVVAYGSKPSVGGQSQRIVFEKNPEADCIVHFHCPKKPESLVPTVSQRAFECGSHECGENTANGLQSFGALKAVYLENHGPNIVFPHTTDPSEVIAFIEENFDLTMKTGGYAIA